MSRLFSGTPLDRPITCPTCGKAGADCRCLKLPPKHKMSEKHGAGSGTGGQSGGQATGQNTAANAYVLTPENATPPKDQLARVQLEKRKGGREITVITGLDHPANDLPKLCAQLKTTLGAGGAVQGRTIEIQGDHRSAIAQILTQHALKTRVI